ncbi:MAG: hypothetical protein H6631_07235 [Anaerolineaceae bacterium]|nr:hypothetical protein [Anaerolineaceae bacterium]MCB9097931.1 hypothetical protein [Anaerolineales bacterium]
MDTYEFSPEQNHKIAELSVRLRHFSIVLGVVGGLVFLNGLARWSTVGVSQGLLTVIGGLIIAGGAYLYSRPLDNFRNIIDLEGRDIEELITAMSDLVLAFKILQFIIAVITLLVCVRLALLFTT